MDFLLVGGYGKRNKAGPTTFAAGGTEIFSQQIPQGKLALVYELTIVPDSNAEVIIDLEYSEFFEDRHVGAFSPAKIESFLIDATNAAKTLHVKVQGPSGGGTGGKATVSMKWVEW